MRSRRRATVSELREVIDCLPRKTKVAMLEGIRANEIIVGAYSTSGGICPMLAAHRAGGRTSMIAFARAWDRFAFRDTRKQVARRATERELRVLRTHLEASLLEHEGPSPELAAAMAEHRQLLEQRDRARGQQRAERARDQRSEIPAGWSWLWLFRRYDEYERALARLEQESAKTAASSPEPANVAQASGSPEPASVG